MSVEYVAYKGEEVIAIGTDIECAKTLGVSPKTVRFYTTPTHRRRIAKSKKPESLIVVVRVEI